SYESIETGNISDAMDTLGIQRCVIHGLRSILPKARRAVGFAFTLKQMQRYAVAEGFNLTKHVQAMNIYSQPGDMLVIDVGGRLNICTGGGLNARAMMVRGLSGMIIDGCYRDPEEVIDADFPIFCKGISPVRSYPDLQ